jgi:hypothetical protein
MTTTKSTRKLKESRADAARRRVVSDVEELARTGDAIIEKTGTTAKVAVPVVAAVLVVGGILLTRRAFRSTPPSWTGMSSHAPRSFGGELVRRALLSFATVAVARWARTTPLLPLPALPPPRDTTRAT